MLWWFAQTTLVAGGLAALAAAACRSRRLGPEARHALWLVVLIKFAIPPVVAWPWPVPDAWPAPGDPGRSSEVPPPTRPVEPEPEPSPAPEPSPIAELPAGPAPGPDEPTAPPAPSGGSRRAPIADFPSSHPGGGPPPAIPVSDRIRADRKSGIWAWKSSFPRLLLGVWLAGSVGMVARRSLAVVRFRRSLAGAVPAPPWLVAEARAIGDRLGVRPPPILVARGVGTPLLWCLGRPRLILPAALIDRLEADRWPGILAHELAHLARRDHWVVRLELLAEAVWWWNPLFRLARRRLHEEAERACDARVVRDLPERRFAYAEALVEVCEHLARSSDPSPALGVVGSGASRSLEGRLLMILRDPIPRRPGRRLALAAGLLATLSVPAWTLGQQPDPPPGPADAPKAADPLTPPADPPKPAAPGAARPTVEPTIDEVRAGVLKRLATRGSLSFRYSVATRNRPAHQFDPREAVRVQVADVVLGPDASLRLDVLSVAAAPELRDLKAGDPPVPYIRQFLARDASNVVTFGGRGPQGGPVPFRWQASGGPGGQGDDLAAALAGQNRPARPDVLNVNDPLDPRPANVLDLAGAVLPIFGARTAISADVAGVEVVDGREVVRVAWIADHGIRGLSWVAPTLGFAVVRTEATQDPARTAAVNGFEQGRRTWRKTAGDFVKVGGAWLPRKVESRFTEVDAQGRTVASRELLATFEDFRVNSPLPADAFHPKFKIEALDEKTGNFTTISPAPEPGLVDRLKRAVAESPFGPTGDRELAQAEARPPAPEAPKAEVPPAAVPSGANPKASRASRAEAPPGDLADPTPPPAARPPEPTPDRPAEAPTVQDPIDARLRRDPQLIEAAAEVAAMEKRLELIRRVSRVESDPAVRKAQGTLAQARERYQKVREQKEEMFRSRIADGQDIQGRPDGHETALRQARHDAKSAEVRKAEAQRDLARAVVDRNELLLKKGPNYVRREEIAKGEGELKVAEAEVASKKAELVEVDLTLDRAGRRPGPGPDPIPAAPSTLADFRDAVELMEVQLQGKQADLRGAEVKFSTARNLFEGRKPLATEGRITQSVWFETEAGLQAAQAEVDRKKADVLEFEVRLKQSRRRAEAEEARLRREVDRAKADLDHTEQLHKMMMIGERPLQAARDRYDDLMFQLDPKHDPAHPAAAEKAGAVTGPGLAVKLAGPGTRQAGETNEYKLSVSNPGSATTGGVKVAVSLPTEGGRLLKLPDRASFVKELRKLVWDLDPIEPGRSVELTFAYVVSTPGLYRATAEVTSGDLRADDAMTTEVTPTP